MSCDKPNDVETEPLGESSDGAPNVFTEPADLRAGRAHGFLRWVPRSQWNRILGYEAQGADGSVLDVTTWLQAAIDDLESIALAGASGVPSFPSASVPRPPAPILSLPAGLLPVRGPLRWSGQVILEGEAMGATILSAIYDDLEGLIDRPESLIELGQAPSGFPTGPATLRRLTLSGLDMASRLGLRRHLLRVSATGPNLRLDEVRLHGTAGDGVVFTQGVGRLAGSVVVVESVGGHAFAISNRPAASAQRVDVNLGRETGSSFRFGLPGTSPIAPGPSVAIIPPGMASHPAAAAPLASLCPEIAIEYVDYTSDAGLVKDAPKAVAQALAEFNTVPAFGASGPVFGNGLIRVSDLKELEIRLTHGRFEGSTIHTSDDGWIAYDASVGALQVSIQHLHGKTHPHDHVCLVRGPSATLALHALNVNIEGLGNLYHDPTFVPVPGDSAVTELISEHDVSGDATGLVLAGGLQSNRWSIQGQSIGFFKQGDVGKAPLMVRHGDLLLRKDVGPGGSNDWLRFVVDPDAATWSSSDPRLPRNNGLLWPWENPPILELLQWDKIVDNPTYSDAVVAKLPVNFKEKPLLLRATAADVSGQFPSWLFPGLATSMSSPGVGSMPARVLGIDAQPGASGPVATFQILQEAFGSKDTAEAMPPGQVWTCQPRSAGGVYCFSQIFALG